MQHLEAERLAALDHDAPSLDELAHLAACAACRAERESYAVLAGMAAAMGRDPSDSPRLTAWDTLSAELRREGLLTSTADITPMRTPAVVRALVQAPQRHEEQEEAGVEMPYDVQHARRAGGRGADVPPPTRSAARGSRRWSTPTWARAAAAVTLLAGSALVGRLSAGWNGQEGAAAADATGVSAGVVAQQVLGTRDAYASVDDATAALSRAQGEYERASLWLASHDTTTRSSDVYRARLAALDQMMAASRAALQDAPQDPVLNHYFLSAYTAREATLQQLGGALPADKTIESY